MTKRAVLLAAMLVAVGLVGQAVAMDLGTNFWNHRYLASIFRPSPNPENR